MGEAICSYVNVRRDCAPLRREMMATVWAVVDYLPEANLIRLAKRRGWKEGESLWDYADEYQASEARRFPNEKMAKGWAEKNATVDMHQEPRVRVMRDAEYGPDMLAEWLWQDGKWTRIDE